MKMSNGPNRSKRDLYIHSFAIKMTSNSSGNIGAGAIGRGLALT